MMGVSPRVSYLLASSRGVTDSIYSCTLLPTRTERVKSLTMAGLGEAVTAYKASAAERGRNEQKLRKIVISENAICADCLTPLEFRTAWASINLGVFVCIQCSGIIEHCCSIQPSFP